MLTENTTQDRRAGHGRRHDDGRAAAARTMSGHAVAHHLLGILNLVVIGCFVLGALWIVKEMVVPFAGRTTSVQASISIAVACTMTLGGCWAGRELKFRKQRKEVERLRLELERTRSQNRRVKAVNAKRGR